MKSYESYSAYRCLFLGDFIVCRCLAPYGVAIDFYDVGACKMWTTPKVTEIAVGLEINCYACADL